MSYLNSLQQTELQYNLYNPATLGPGEVARLRDDWNRAVYSSMWVAFGTRQGGRFSQRGADLQRLRLERFHHTKYRVSMFSLYFVMSVHTYICKNMY